VTLPGLDDGDDPRSHRLTDATDHIVRVIEERDLTAVVLVGHSWGGYPINGATARLPAASTPSSTTPHRCRFRAVR
jgi:pimeloyl-ACP methyl ester carboxylesterase